MRRSPAIRACIWRLSWYRTPQARTDYYAVTSNFRTDASGWRFLKLFTRPKAAELAADFLVFEQENDLVVDTESMTFHAFGDRPDIANDRLFRCFEGDEVHHTNYFQHRDTVDFITRSFGV